MQSEAELQGFFFKLLSTCQKRRRGFCRSAASCPKVALRKNSPRSQVGKQKIPHPCLVIAAPLLPRRPDRASPTPSAPASPATPWRLVFPSAASILHLRSRPDETSVSFAFLRSPRRRAGDLCSPVVDSLPEGNHVFTRPSSSSGRPSRREAGADGFPISLPLQQIPLFARGS